MTTLVEVRREVFSAKAVLPWLLSLTALGGGAGLNGQTAAPAAPATVKLSAADYLTPLSVPPNARLYLVALGNRIQIAGNERLTLAGTVTDHLGTGTAQLVWQLPGSVRLDRQTSPSASLVFVAGSAVGSAAGSGVQNASAVPQADLNILETVAADAQEAFLYTFRQKAGHRLLGARFRADDGKTPNYQGPYYDIYESTGQVPAANNAVRQKWYFFDSTSHLLAKARYLIGSAGATVTVESQYSNWTTQNGQAFAGKIIRTENGAAVFTFTATQGVVGPAVKDGLFPTP